MSLWAAEHRALLTALRAQAVVPSLVQRLSLERHTADEAEVRRLQGWAQSLREESCWAELEPLIEAPDAWPAAWETAVSSGLSGRSEHHAALFFQRTARRFIADGDWDGASWAHGECVGAWTRLFSGDYPRELLSDLDANLSGEGPDGEAMLLQMLDGLTDDLERHLLESSGVAKPGDEPGIERRKLRFAWGALERVEAPTGGPDPYGTLARLSSRARQARLGTTSQLLRRFEKSVADFDLSAVQDDELVAPLRWVREYCEVVGYSEDAVTTVISTIVETCWGLRRVDRDEIAGFKQLLKLGDPFNRDLFRRVTSLDSAFGHNSRCADFLAFVAEDQTGDARQQTLETALEVCPNHRNSSMLRSYDILAKATLVITELALINKFAMKTPGTRKRVQAKVDEAEAHLVEAEAMYPYNSKLPDVRERLKKEMRRLNVYPSS